MPFDPAFFLTLLRPESPLHDAAIHAACLHITLINEAPAQSQATDRRFDLQYAVSPKGELVRLITQSEKEKMLFWKIAGEASFTAH